MTRPVCVDTAVDRRFKSFMPCCAHSASFALCTDVSISFQETPSSHPPSVALRGESLGVVVAWGESMRVIALLERAERRRAVP
eukprot:CAMPEP_0184697118 /NCGR_PEP_ID=MMETSP0313-20130426/4192_1 /TAXON_ID=2792 /ORGANISM="Porphyridium aerugineum, Strain SAG 1380-2" /LENGTH=82 /DNA_ID=CAMNT_0027155881 /DNA_START=282 /DNA_END=530 /DNA_ORIENTATION=+